MALLKEGEAVRSPSGVFEVVARVGAGGQGQGYKVRGTSGREGIFFLKQYTFVTPSSDGDEAFAKRQSGVVERLTSSTFVQKIYEFFEFDHLYYQLAEWEQGISLNDHLQEVVSAETDYSQDDRRINAVALAFAVRNLHDSQQVAHLDISPNNVRMVQSESGATVAQLTDFDMASLDGEPPEIFGGTPGYTAPERWSQDWAAKTAPGGYASDVFSVACLLWEILLGTQPWKGSVDPEDPCLLVRTPDTCVHPAQVSALFSREPAMGATLWSALDPDPRKRPSMSDIHELTQRLVKDSLFPERHPDAPLPFPDSDAAPPTSRMPQRIALVSDSRRVRITDSMILGREQLRLVEGWQTVSSRHARIFKVDGDGWFISHMSKTNPTLLNDESLPELARRRLTDGCVIQMGDLVVKVEFEN